MPGLERTAIAGEFDFDAALRIVDAANPQLPLRPDRCRLAGALVLLAAENRSEILAAADARRTAKFDADGRHGARALDAWMTKARRRGEVGHAQAWEVLELLSKLRIWSEPTQPSPASRPGRRPKGDLRVYGVLVCIYEIVTGRPAANDKAFSAFARDFMAAAGGTFAAVEAGSVCPPREQVPGTRWKPLSPGAFRKRFKQIERAKDPARAHRLIERAAEERKK